MKITPIKNINYNFHKPIKHNIAKVSNPIKNDTPFMSVETAAAIFAASMVKPAITKKDIEDKLLQHGFEKLENDEYKKDISAEKEEELRGKMSFFVKNYKKYFDKPLQQYTIEWFRDFLNIDSNVGHKLLDKNFDNTLLTFLILGNNCRLKTFETKCEEDKNYFGLIENIAKSDMENNLYSFAAYKMDSDSAMNMELRKKAKNPDYEIQAYLKKDIDNISNYIDKQIIKNPIKLYRSEGYEILDNVQTDDGKVVNLSEMMLKAKENDDAEIVNQIREFVLDNKVTAIQDGFMSTSISKERGTDFFKNGIAWEITTAPNTKGVFVEGLNISAMYPSEDEVLLQKGTKLLINDIQYDKDEKRWTVFATASN